MRCTAELVSDPKFNSILDAAQQGPVVIERAQEEVALVISARQYRLWRRQAVDNFNQFCDEISDRAEVRGMTEDKLNELLASDWGPVLRARHERPDQPCPGTTLDRSACVSPSDGCFEILILDDTFQELETVIVNAKFDRYSLL